MNFMSTIPLFLQRLSLDESADERAIRRAYARELKLIDQEVKPQEFQELRELYEGALQWARQKIALVSSDIINEHQSPEPTSERLPNNSVALENTESTQNVIESTITVDYQKIYQELEDFRLFCDGMQRRDEPVGDLVSWQEKLNEILARREFDNLHARGIFEANIIYQLVSGWKPGYETLFVAAANVFRWREEPNRLKAFGEGGAIIDLAVLQYLMFEDLRGSPQYPYFRKAVARLRIGKQPAVSELLALYPYMEVLAQHYPTWLSIITDVSSLEAWQKKDKEIPAWRRKYGNFSALKAVRFVPKSLANWHWSARLFLFFIVMSVVTAIFNPEPQATRSRYQSPALQAPIGSESQPRIPSSAELVRQVNSSPHTSGPTVVQVRPIYPGMSLLRKEEGTVIVRVLINELGSVNEAEIVQSSGFSLLDNAALEAAKNGSFKPYVEHGKPKPVLATLPVAFSLSDYRK